MYYFLTPSVRHGSPHVKGAASPAAILITGGRKQEVLTLQWHQVDREAGTVRLDPGMTKGGEWRIIVLEGELREVIEAQ